MIDYERRKDVKCLPVFKILLNEKTVVDLTVMAVDVDVSFPRLIFLFDYQS